MTDAAATLQATTGLSGGKPVTSVATDASIDPAAETGTPAWLALKFGPSTFGILDTFADEAGRQAHLTGPIAAALMANAAALLGTPPTIERIDLLAAKLPGAR